MRWSRRVLEVHEVWALERQDASGVWRFDVYTETESEANGIIAYLDGTRIGKRYALIATIGDVRAVLGFFETQAEAQAAYERESV